MTIPTCKGYFRVLIRLFSLVVNMVILYVFVEWVGLDDLIVKIGAAVVVVIMNYGISKWLVFNPKHSR